MMIFAEGRAGVCGGTPAGLPVAVPVRSAGAATAVVESAAAGAGELIAPMSANCG
jgi:hypothetical protein